MPLQRVDSPQQAEAIRELGNERLNRPDIKTHSAPKTTERNAAREYIVILDDTLAAATYDKTLDTYRLAEQGCTLWERSKAGSFGYSASPEEFQKYKVGNDDKAYTKLVPVRDDAQRCVRRRIFNVYPKSYPPCIPLRASQDTRGDLYIQENPDLAYPGYADGTTTTSTTTTIAASCAGSCLWEWDAPTKHWNITTNGCTNPTTTTTTSTTTSAGQTTTSTTTTEACDCTSKPTTTSTTTSACSCLYPTFCGFADGDCTRTFCARGDNAEPPNCPDTTTTTSTTTSCNCNTTTTSTTTTHPPCLLGCEWKFIINPFTGLGGWFNTFNGCALYCPCPLPTGVGSDCQETSTPCILTSTTTSVPPGPFCLGGCLWTALDDGDWVLVSTSCFGNIPCGCSKPTIAGNPCSEVSTPCITPPTTTTTTTSTSTTDQLTRCQRDCYTTTTLTTTSSTTSANCEDRKCIWAWSDVVVPAQWLLRSSNCIPFACGCSSPPYDGTLGCELIETPCAGTTTTTTTTTTSTTTSVCPCNATVCNNYNTYSWQPLCCLVCDNGTLRAPIFPPDQDPLVDDNSWCIPCPGDFSGVYDEDPFCERANIDVCHGTCYCLRDDTVVYVKEGDPCPPAGVGLLACKCLCSPPINPSTTSSTSTTTSTTTSAGP